ncbi:MAG: hypothetical protein WCJ19_03815 [bacterium]
MLFSPFILSFVSASSSLDSLSRENGSADCFYINANEAFGGGTMINSQRSNLCDLTAGVAADPCASQAELCASLTKAGINPSSYVDGGALGMLAQVTEYVSAGAGRTGVDSVVYVAEKFSPTVSAQTSALQGLSPILVLWGTLRNVSYILIALSLVITGLALYFNGKAGGKQDNVAIAGSIVDIIGTLLTITFSYLIAGITVDLIINLGNAAVASFFQPFINSTSILNNLYSQGSNTNILTMMSDFQKSGSSTSVINLLQQGLENLQTPIQNTSGFFKGITDTAGNAVFSFAAGSVIALIFNIARGIVSITLNQPLITAIISFTIFIIIFRVVFMLLGSFVGIILQIGFAPLILIPGAFPGIASGKVFVDWLKKIVAAALVFPVVFALLLLSAIFLNVSQNGDNGNCVYDSSVQTQVPITGSYPITTYDENGVANTVTSISKPDVFNTTRFTQKQNGNTALTQDAYDPIRNCFPIMLPPKFNWIPAPLGNLGSKFEADDFTRFIVGIAIIIMIPSITKAIQGALQIKSQPLGSIQDAMAGAGIFNTFVQQVPIIGKPISQITGAITGAIK